MDQMSLQPFCTHADGGTTISYLTLALHRSAAGGHQLFLVMDPDDGEGHRESLVVGPEHSVRHQIDLALALLSGRLVRDFTREGRRP